MRRRENSNAQEQAKQFIANAGSMFSKWGVNLKNGASKLGGKTVRATTHALKSTQKLGMEKLKGMQSSVEDAQFLSRKLEIEEFFVLVKRLQQHKQRILRSQQNLHLYSQSFWRELSKLPQTTDLNNTLVAVGESHMQNEKNEKAFLATNEALEQFLSKLMAIDFQQYRDASQRYEVTKINFDIATHNHASLNSVPGPELEFATKRLDIETDAYQTVKQQIESIHEQMKENQTKLKKQMLQVEVARKKYLATLCGSLAQIDNVPDQTL